MPKSGSYGRGHREIWFDFSVTDRSRDDQSVSIPAIGHEQTRLRGYTVLHASACKLAIGIDPFSRRIIYLAPYQSCSAGSGVSAKPRLAKQLLSKLPLQSASPYLRVHTIMASQSSAEARTALKKSLQWINDEVDRLGVCWCAVKYRGNQ